MDKKDWKESLARLKALLPVKELEIKRCEKDIEEIKVTIRAYENKIKTLR
jgi:hypothetical protein